MNSHMKVITNKYEIYKYPVVSNIYLLKKSIIMYKDFKDFSSTEFTIASHFKVAGLPIGQGNVKKSHESSVMVFSGKSAYY